MTLQQRLDMEDAKARRARDMAAKHDQARRLLRLGNTIEQAARALRMDRRVIARLRAEAEEASHHTGGI